MKKIYHVIVLLFVLIIFTSCSQSDKENTAKNGDGDALTPVSFVLDWTPNTNHTGIYVAKELGYFADQGLDVDILLPGEVGTNQLVASGKAEFGVSYQERIPMARAEGLPLVSIAAVIQHNTAGYMSPLANDITEPKDFEGKRFGGIGAPIQEAMMQTIMKQHGADFDKVDLLNIGDSDFFAAVKRDVDFATTYYGWTGIEAELRDEPMNMMYYVDFAEELDFYTPILVTNEKLIASNPELITAFIQAATKGYEYAIDQPKEAADILLKHESDLDSDLVHRSQEWLAPRYQDDANQWGLQELSRWEKVIDFMVEHKIIDKKIDAKDAFTTEFLPK